MTHTVKWTGIELRSSLLDLGGKYFRTGTNLAPG
jgi:hypothetical protein